MTTDHGGSATAQPAGSNGGRETRWRGRRWRVAAWTAAAGLLLVPLVAMLFTEAVNWSAGDFVFAGLLIVGTGLAFELAVWRTASTAYRVAIGVALAGVFLLVWINAAVGLIGAASNDANLMYSGVLAAGLIGAVAARFRAAGMGRALLAMALVQALVAGVALVGGLGAPASGPGAIVVLNGGFVVLWLVAAALFRRAAQGPERPA